jgi:hypothetical protein
VLVEVSTSEPTDGVAYQSRVKGGVTVALALGAIGKWGPNVYFINLDLC